MKTIKNILLFTLAIVALTLSSCDDPSYPDNSTDSKEGQLRLSKMTISVSNAEKVIETRSSVDVGTFTVNIKNSAGETVETYKYSEMPELVTLSAGKYTVEAYNSEQQTAAFEAPYFYGASAEFEVKAGEIEDVDPVVCKLANIKVGVFYSDELKKVMGSDVVVNVKVADSEELDFVASETRSGYFKYVEGNTTIVATFTGTVDGYKVSEYKVLTNAVAPGNYHKITFSIKDAPEPPDENGQIGGSGFNMDATVTSIDYTGNVDPGEEDLIDPDDYLTVGRSTVNFKCDASSENVTVKSSGAFTATSNADWCTISNLTRSGFTINATANTDASNDRSAIVTVAMGSMSSTIQVTQAKYTETTTEPTFSSQYLDLTSGNYNDASEFGTSLKPAQVTIAAEEGIKTLHVTIDSETLPESELEGVGLSKDFELTTGLSDDGKDLSEALGGLGFPIKESVLNQKSVNFDITTFVPMLSALGKGKSNFIIKVTDNKNQSATATIRIEVK